MYHLSIENNYNDLENIYKSLEWYSDNFKEINDFLDRIVYP